MICTTFTSHRTSTSADWAFGPTRPRRRGKIDRAATLGGCNLDTNTGLHEAHANEVL